MSPKVKTKLSSRASPLTSKNRIFEVSNRKFIRVQKYPKWNANLHIICQKKVNLKIFNCVWPALRISDTHMLKGNTLFKVHKIGSDGKSFVYRVCNQVFFSVLDLCARQVWHGCERKCDWSTQFHSWKNLMMATNIVNWTSSNIYGLTLISSADIEY